MRKAKKVMVIFLMLLCLLSNYNVMYVHATDSPVSLVERVERYTSNYDEEEIQFYLDKGEYQTAIQLIENAKDGYQERWDYIGLTTNDLYIAYQFKEYMTGEFLSRGWWAKVTSLLSGLVYNDELREYLAMESPGTNKYKDMLINFMQETKDELIFKEYIEELKNSIESIGNNVEFYDILYDMFLEAKSKEDIDKAVLNFVNDNPNFFTDENKTYLFKNNLSKLESQISKSLTFLGAGLEYLDTTISGIMEIDFFVANVEVLTYYEDFLKNIQYIKDDNGDYVAPEELRIAAAELRQEIGGNFSNTIANIINEYGVTTALTGMELLNLVEKGVFSQILLGIDISSMLGNTCLDMSSLIKGVSYVQGYAYAGEIYSIVLERDKDKFLENKSEEAAQQFRKDYEILWNIRLVGEKAYMDMCDFSEIRNEDNQKLLKGWTDYASKEQFIENNIEIIEAFEFKTPDFIKISENAESIMPLTKEEAYKKVEDYWISLGRNMPEEVEYEGLTESGYSFWGYNMVGDDVVTHFWICIDENTGQITVEGGIYHE